MKKLLLMFVFGSFFIMLLSFSVNIDKPVKFNNRLEFKEENCPECKVEYMKCIDAIYGAYAEIITKEVDKFKADSITREEYEKARNRARTIRNEEEKVCDADYIKCCKEEILNNYNNQKEAPTSKGDLKAIL